MTPDKANALREAAEAVHPGKWTARKADDGWHVRSVHAPADDVRITRWPALCRMADGAAEDAAYIALADPPTIIALLAERERLRGALREAGEVFALCEHLPRFDRDYGAEVEALGERIGYGAMMSSAQASWRAKLERSGFAGGEHVSGPSFATVQRTLTIIRQALEATDDQT